MAVLVAVVVSFTLTQMMSARLLRSEDASGHGGGHRSANWREGFYAHIDALYMRMLTWSMGHRKRVFWLAALVVLSSIPLYRMVRQEYIPTDVDEAEFDVNVTAPEGTSVAAMDDMMRAVEGEVRTTPGVTLVLSSVGGGFLGNVNTGSARADRAARGAVLLRPLAE